MVAAGSLEERGGRRCEACSRTWGACGYQGREWLDSLLLASREGHAGVVSLLLYYDANADLSGKTGWTPLMWAADGGHQDVCSFYLTAEQTSICKMQWGKQR